MDFTSPGGEQKYAAIVAAAHETVIALDFDGTLSPIVDDPSRAYIHPDAGEVLTRLATQVRAIAIVTGRPAQQVLDLGNLEEVGDAAVAAGSELYIFGQYGNERWSSSDRSIVGPRPPSGLGTFMDALPGLLRRHDAAEAYVEEKGLAVAVHTRRLPDPAGAFERLLGPVRDLATENDLATEPGRNVIEVRAPGMHKGLVVDRLAEQLEVGGFVFGGDDLGDLEAFDAVAALGKGGLPTLLVCSASDEQSALVPLSDVVVDGPAGVLDLLGRLASDASGS